MSDIITGSDYIKLRDYPVALNEDGSINEKSRKAAHEKKMDDLRWAIKSDIDAYNRTSWLLW